MSFDKPAVSILIPIHNCERYLNRSLDSIMNQSFQDYEVIVVLNCCTDNSENIVKSYQKEFPLKILECDEPGIVPALNTGIFACEGDLIARQDGDDYWYPDKLVEQVEFLNQNPDVDIVGTQIRMVDSELKPIEDSLTHPLVNLEIKQKLLAGNNAIAHPSVVFRRKIFNKAGIYEDTYKFAEDYYLWLKCVRWYKFANLPDIMVDYRISNNPDFNPKIPQMACYNMLQVLKQQGLIQ